MASPWLETDLIITNGFYSPYYYVNYPCNCMPCECDLPTSFTVNLSADLTISTGPGCCTLSHTWTSGTNYVVTTDPYYYLRDYCYYTNKESLGTCSGHVEDFYAMVILIYNAYGPYWMVQFSINYCDNAQPGPLGCGTKVVASIFGETVSAPTQCDPTDASMAYTRGASYGGCSGTEDGGTKSVTIS